jgi:hypothetical protein
VVATGHAGCAAARQVPLPRVPRLRGGIATNILADRLSRLEAAGLLERTGEDPRSGKQSYHATTKGKDLIPLLLEMMAWSAAHDPKVAVPELLITELATDFAATARAVRDLGGIEAFLAALPPA